MQEEPVDNARDGNAVYCCCWTNPYGYVENTGFETIRIPSHGRWYLTIRIAKLLDSDIPDLVKVLRALLVPDLVSK